MNGSKIWNRYLTKKQQLDVALDDIAEKMARWWIA